VVKAPSDSLIGSLGWSWPVLTTSAGAAALAAFVLPEDSVGPTVITLPVEDVPEVELSLPVAVLEEDPSAEGVVGEPPDSVPDPSGGVVMPPPVAAPAVDDEVLSDEPPMTVTESSEALLPVALSPAAPVPSVDPPPPGIADPSVLGPDDPPMTVTPEELSDCPRAPMGVKRHAASARKTANLRCNTSRCALAVDQGSCMAIPRFDGTSYA
jgi:hypothetical protein